MIQHIIPYVALTIGVIATFFKRGKDEIKLAKSTNEPINWKTFIYENGLDAIGSLIYVSALIWKIDIGQVEELGTEVSALGAFTLGMAIPVQVTGFLQTFGLGNETRRRTSKLIDLKTDMLDLPPHDVPFSKVEKADKIVEQRNVSNPIKYKIIFIDEVPGVGDVHKVVDKNGEELYRGTLTECDQWIASKK